MSELISLRLVIALIILVVLLGKWGRVKNLKINDWLAVEYFPLTKSGTAVSSKSKFGIVVSSDGKIYKVQTEFSIKSDRATELCNASLLVSGIGWFVFRQLFTNTTAGRVPNNRTINLQTNTVTTIGLEFEPKEGWKPISLSRRAYKCLVIFKTTDQVIKHKFTFQVREQNILAMNNMIPNRANIIEVPIIKN